MDFNRIIGNNIRTKRTERRLTIEELSEALDISPGFLGLIERGKRGTNLQNLCKIKDFFGITLDELVTKSSDIKIEEEMDETLNNKKETILGYLNLMGEKELQYFIETIKIYFNYIKE